MINKMLMSLEQSIGIPVAPDIYEGKASRYIVFALADERSAMYANDEEEYTQYSVNISYYCPHDHNYLADKRKIKAELKRMGFQVEYITSYVEAAEIGTDKVRHTVFVTNYVGKE